MQSNLFFTTAFAFMSCDGDIAPEEIQLIRDMYDEGLFPDVDCDTELTTLVERLNKEGKNFLKLYLSSVEDSNLSKDDALKLLKIAVKTIYADKIVEYSEVKFFRAVRRRIHAIDDYYILANISEIEDFWLASDTNKDSDSIEKDYFDSVELPQFNIDDVKQQKKS